MALMATAQFNHGAEDPKMLIVTDEAARVRLHVRHSAIAPILFDPARSGPQLYPSFDPKAPLAPIERTVRGALKKLALGDANLRPALLTHEEEFEQPIGVDPYIMLPAGTEIGTDDFGRPIRLSEGTQLPDANNDPSALFDMLSNGIVPGRRCAGYRIPDDPLDGLVPATFMRLWARRVDNEPAAPDLAQWTQHTIDTNKRAANDGPHDPANPFAPMTEYEVMGLQPHQPEPKRGPDETPLVGVRIFDRINYLNWLHGTPGSKGDASRSFGSAAVRPAALGALPPILKWKLPPTRHPQPNELRLLMHSRDIK